MGASSQMGEIKYHFCVAFSFFCHHKFCSHPGIKPKKRLWRGLIHKTSFSGYCITRGIKLHKASVSPIFTQKHPKGAWIGIFKPNSHNIENHISSKLQRGFQLNVIWLESAWAYACLDHPRFVGGPSRRRTNPRWRTAAIFKNPCNSLTDQHTVWQDDAYWSSVPYRQLKFRTFKNLCWQTAAILENGKTVISRQRLDGSARSLARWRILALWSVPAVKISNF